MPWHGDLSKHKRLVANTACVGAIANIDALRARRTRLDDVGRLLVALRIPAFELDRDVIDVEFLA